MHSRSIGCRDNGTGGSICLSEHISRPNMNPGHITMERKPQIVLNSGNLGGPSEVTVHTCKQAGFH